MHVHAHAAARYRFVATAGIESCSDVRPAHVRDLSIAGAYFAMPHPFSEGASIFVKIRTEIEFFQSRATVAHSAEGLGMTVMFYEVSPPFLLVWQGWILDAAGLQSGN
jgi:PilZ domain